MRAGNVEGDRKAKAGAAFVLVARAVEAEKRPEHVLAEIVGGNWLLAAAAILKITEVTPRPHAQRILAKTGTTRQTELIRRFFETALAAAPASA